MEYINREFCNPENIVVHSDGRTNLRYETGSIGRQSPGVRSGGNQQHQLVENNHGICMEGRESGSSMWISMSQQKACKLQCLDADQQQSSQQGERPNSLEPAMT